MEKSDQLVLLRVLRLKVDDFDSYNLWWKAVGMLKQVLHFLVLTTVTVSSLRFDSEPVTADTGVLTVNNPSKLTCNYVKFSTENVREIIWYAGYNGMKTKVCKTLLNDNIKLLKNKEDGVHISYSI